MFSAVSLWQFPAVVIREIVLGILVILCPPHAVVPCLKHVQHSQARSNVTSDQRGSRMEKEGSVSSFVLNLQLFPILPKEGIHCHHECMHFCSTRAWTALTSRLSARSYPSAIECSLMHLILRYTSTTCTKCTLFQLFINKLGRFILVV